MNVRALAASLAVLVAAPAWAGASEPISQKEYYAVTYYREALEHPKIQKLKAEKKKVEAIARDIGMKPRDLEKALAKVEALGEDPAEAAQKAIKQHLDGTNLKGKVLDVLMNTEEPKHVVLYVRWKGSSSKEVLKEASQIAHAVAAEAPFVATLSLAAIPPLAPNSSRDTVWSAKIGADRMASIQENRIQDYADSLYGRLFEVVDNQKF